MNKVNNEIIDKLTNVLNDIYIETGVRIEAIKLDWLLVGMDEIIPHNIVIDSKITKSID